ncbi:MAG: hypothetical protein KAH86_06465, partial [Methanosarcinales archaeon]|nr:hypothetical protein [Methanosarcinales archaeon]
MIVSVDKSKVQGTVFAPSSKSYTHRAIAIAALSSSKLTIRHPLISADTKSSIRAAIAMGATIDFVRYATKTGEATDKAPIRELGGTGG